MEAGFAEGGLGQAPSSPGYPGFDGSQLNSSGSCLSCPQAKILEHDDVSYLKKILGELAMVLDQIEAELEKRKLENEGGCQLWGRWVLEPIQSTRSCPLPAPLSQRS